jgi:hypothetical protein
MQGTAPTSAGRGFQKWDDFGGFFYIEIPGRYWELSEFNMIYMIFNMIQLVI